MRVAMDSANMSVKKEVSEMTKEELLQGYQAWGTLLGTTCARNVFRKCLGSCKLRRLLRRTDASTCALAS